MDEIEQVLPEGEESAVANTMASTYRIDNIDAILETEEEGCLFFYIDFSVMIVGEVLESFTDMVHVYRASDPYGMTPQLTQWMADNPDFPITPYVAPPPLTPEQLRELMPTLDRLDFKTRFKAAGMNLAKINAYFASIEEDESHWEDMQNYYTETPRFYRLAPFVVELAAFSLKTPEQIDVIWTA